MEPSHRLALLAAGGLFLLYLLLKLRVSLAPGSAAVREARKGIAELKRKARDKSLSKEMRAEAWLSAADTALRDMGRADLAASYALRADRLSPGEGAAVGRLANAMRLSSRHRALEKLLWRRIDKHAPTTGAFEQSFEQLVALYEGPMHAPERARALRKLAGRRS